MQRIYRADKGGTSRILPEELGEIVSSGRDLVIVDVERGLDAEHLAGGIASVTRAVWRSEMLKAGKGGFGQGFQGRQ